MVAVGTMIIRGLDDMKRPTDLLRWGYCLITGRTHRWERLNNEATLEMWDIVRECPSPASTILPRLILAVRSICLHLTDPRNEDRLIGLDVKELHEDDVWFLYEIHIGGLSGVFAILNPGFRPVIRSALKHVCDENGLGIPIFDATVAEGRSDLREIAGTLWGKCEELLGIDEDESDPRDDVKANYLYPVLLATFSAGVVCHYR